MMNETVRRAIEAAGGPTALARKLGIKSPSLYSWTKIPAERVEAVHEATGIPREDLRPDIFREPRVDRLMEGSAA